MQQQQRKPVRITSKLIKQYDRGCGTCIHHHEEYNENSEDPIGICTAHFKQGIGSRGARNENKHCGMQGRWYERDPECGDPVISKRGKRVATKKKRIQPPKPKSDDPPRLEDMTLEELEAIPRDELTIGEKGKLTKQINKLKE